MATISDSALLSLYVYDVALKINSNGESNRPRLPDGWTPVLGSPAKDDANGFSYGVFRHTSELIGVRLQLKSIFSP